MEHLEHFGLRQDPFRNDPQLAFYFASPQHTDAERRLLRGVRQGKGLSVIVGDSGCGKTMLVHHLLDGLDEDRFEASLIVMVHAGCDSEWLLQCIARSLGVGAPAPTRVELLGQLYEQLITLREEGRRPVVVIDEAQMLTRPETLTELRGLLNLEHDEQRLLSLVLSGLPELDQLLRQDLPLAERIDIRVELARLDEATAAAYLAHRIATAGGDAAILEPATAAAIARVSGGIPRRMNTLADNALFEAYIAERERVLPEDVERAAQDLPWARAAAAAPAPEAASGALPEPPAPVVVAPVPIAASPSPVEAVPVAAPPPLVEVAPVATVPPPASAVPVAPEPPAPEPVVGVPSETLETPPSQPAGQTEPPPSLESIAPQASPGPMAEDPALAPPLPPGPADLPEPPPVEVTPPAGPEAAFALDSEPDLPPPAPAAEQWAEAADPASGFPSAPDSPISPPIAEADLPPFAPEPDTEPLPFHPEFGAPRFDADTTAPGELEADDLSSVSAEVEAVLCEDTGPGAPTALPVGEVEPDPQGQTAFLADDGETVVASPGSAIFAEEKPEDEFSDDSLDNLFVNLVEQD